MKHPLYTEWTPKPPPDWNAAWHEQREATGRARWDGWYAAQRPTRGELINRRCYVGSQVTTLRTVIPELEKAARRTPPKTLREEWRKVEQAKIELSNAKARRAELGPEWERLRAEAGRSA